MDAKDISADLTKVIFTEDQILARVAELAAAVERDYEGRDLLLVGVLKGATILMSDLDRKSTRLNSSH